MPNFGSADLDALLEEIERVWREEADLSAAARLAREYPEYLEDIQAFVASMLEAEMGPNLDPEAMAASATRTQELVQTLGYQTLAEQGQEGTAATAAVPSAAPASAPGTLLELLRLRTGAQRPRALAQALGVTAAFLYGLGQCLSVPTRAAEELAVRVHRAFGVAVDEVRAVLLAPRGTTVLASADAPQPTEPLTYADVVGRAGLPPEEAAFWRALEGEAP